MFQMKHQFGGLPLGNAGERELPSGKTHLGFCHQDSSDEAILLAVIVGERTSMPWCAITVASQKPLVGGALFDPGC